MRLLLLGLLSSIFVNGQADFDKLPETIGTELKAGAEQIDVRIGPGVYYYSDRFLALEKIDAPGTSLRISGEGAVLVGSDGGDRTYSTDIGYVDIGNLKDVDIRSEMRRAKFWPVKVPFTDNLFRLRTPSNIPRSKEESKDLTLLMTQWYIGAVYPIEKITENYIYFRKEKHYTTMFGELRFGRCLPRFLICSPPDEKQQKSLYPCRSTCFLAADSLSLRSFVMEGLHFLGNGNNDEDWMIRLRGVRSDTLTIRGCRFEGIRSRGIRVENSEGFLAENNEFYRCYRCCISLATSAKTPVVRKNRFIDNTRQIVNSPVVDCKGENFLVADNYFEDFSSLAIGAGHHYAVADDTGNSGIIERNEICMSEAFRSGVFRELIDSGAIYIWTKTNGITIRDNYIHDLDGPHGNRGILCDDGTVNVTICTNRLMRIRGGRCIDLRNHMRVERLPDSRIRRVNVGNRIWGNIIDGVCHFYVREDDPSSFKGENIII